MKLPETDDRYKMTLRLPQGLAEKLKAKAREERRSITTTLEIILEEYFADQEEFVTIQRPGGGRRLLLSGLYPGDDPVWQVPHTGKNSLPALSAQLWLKSF